jgi:transcriptional regulator with XRE-family HTH domain
MWKTMSKRIPTAKDRAKARTLKTLWESRKRDLELTQNSAAKKLDLTQPTFSQYLNAVIPLNTDTILKFAQLLQVDPKQIDSSIIDINALTQNAVTTSKSVPFIGSISGKSIIGVEPVIAEGLTDQHKSYAAVLIDTHELNSVGLHKGSAIILDLYQKPPSAAETVIVKVRGEDGYRMCTFVDTTQTTYKMSCISTQKGFSLKKNAVLSMYRIAASVVG